MSEEKKNDGGRIDLQVFTDVLGQPYIDGGVSLRDWFAGMALQGWLATFHTSEPQESGVAEFCYKMADAMIAARDK